MKYFVLLLLFSVSHTVQAASYYEMYYMRHSIQTTAQAKQPIRHKLLLPPMPQHCDTPKTMNIWYAEVAKQSREEHHTVLSCITELRKLGASSTISRISCKAP